MYTRGGADPRRRRPLGLVLANLLTPAVGAHERMSDRHLTRLPARSVTGLAISSEMHQPTEKCFSTVGNVWSLHRPVHANSSTFS